MICPHLLVDHELAKLLNSEGYEVAKSKDISIVFKDIRAPEDISKESVDSITEELQKHIRRFSNVESDYGPHVLVRKKARGRLENDTPAGYIVELNDEHPIVYSLKHPDDIPLLIGYGSLLDPLELACNTGGKDLRNKLTDEEKHMLINLKNIEQKVRYTTLPGMRLIFEKAPTAARYREIQGARNDYAVLTARKGDGDAYVSVFDPSDLTHDPRHYFARENFDEMEYNRRRVDVAGQNAWVLESPLVTDANDTLQSIVPNRGAEIPDNYIHMITNGLSAAEKAKPGFARDYVENTYQTDGRKLSENDKFMEMLEKKLQ